ncbi:hypothetical protein cypCar_00037768 [Cyprinus carpio]|nr:hypothetical protein cypCar_00037768 [Cyprinus carpio]
MGCASSFHISDRVVNHSGKESEDSQNCPQPGHIKPSNACQGLTVMETLTADLLLTGTDPTTNQLQDTAPVMSSVPEEIPDQSLSG